MVEYTETIWSGVAAIPWPYAVVARIVSFHWSSGRMMPLDSLGTRRRSRARARTVRGREGDAPIRSATMTAPMLLDSATMSPRVICIGRATSRG